jgi:fatty-acyl-CoA synthase
LTDAVFGVAPHGDAGLTVGAPAAPKRLAWAEIHRLARRMAGSLDRARIGPGDTVAVLAGAPADVAPLIQAVWARGAAATMLHQPTPRIDRAHWIGDTLAVLRMIDAAAVVVGPPFESCADTLRESGFAVLHADLLALGQEIEPVAGAEDDVALLQLSSGSTGSPKAIAVTHHNLHRNWAAIRAGGDYDPAHDVMISWVPLFHDMGMVMFLAGPMQSGMETVLVTPADFVASPLLWAELISRHRGTVTGGPNFAYSVLARALADAPAHAYDLSSMRYMFNGAEPVDPATVDLLERAGGRFGLRPQALTAAYGMAEATLVISMTKPGERAGVDTVDAEALAAEGRAPEITWKTSRPTRRYVRLGKPIAGMGVRVVDASGARLPPREVGELHVRGESVTRRCLTRDGWRDACDADGWLATGDLGYLTDTGEVVICGRLKDTIIVGGRNLFPTDIERAACRVPGVRPGNAAAVRVRPAEHREQFAVVVESRLHDDAAAAERIRAEVAREVFAEIGASPRLVSVTSPGSLPKTSSGKLRRAALAALLERAGLRADETAVTW